MRENGFVSVVLLVIVLIVAAGAILFSQKGVAPLDPSNPSDSTLRQEVNLDAEAKKGTYYFDIATLNNYKYEFEWEAYTSESENEHVYKAIFNFNVGSPIHIVKTDLSSSKKTIVKENVLALNSSGTAPYLKVLLQPPTTNKIYIEQGREGTSAKHRSLVNFEIGQMVEFYPSQDERRNCQNVPFKDKNQKSIIFSCEYDLPKDNPSEVTKSNERLFSYNLVTEKRNQLDTLLPGETIICVWDPYIDAKPTYIAANQVKLEICNSKRELIRSEIYTY